MKKIITLPLFLLLLIGCSSDGDDSTPTLSAVSDLVIDDITNQGNASDIQVSFTTEEEDNLESYRLFMVKTTQAGSFSLTAAEGKSEGFFEITKGVENQEVLLNSSTRDSDGEEIVEGVSYTGFILSMGMEGVPNVLSGPSNALTLKQSTIKITYIGNDGVHISDGANAVIIDALPGDLTGWSTIVPGVQSALENGEERFGSIKAAMVTHAHGDHVSSASINRFLSANRTAKVILPPSLHNSITSSAQISELAPNRGESAEADFDGVSITVMHLRHFDLFGNDFSGVDNYGYLIEIGGKKVLHLGDVFYSAENFTAFNFTDENIDVLLIPTFDALISNGNKALVDEHIAPANIIGLHLLSSTTVASVNNVYPEARVFKTSMEFERY